jgi:EAL domain-containing protein (putative c-di-GMP-specific phosphodiesterase class I)
MRARVLRRVAIEQELRQAIDRDQLAIAYQPLIDLGDDTVGKCEALLRWTHPDHGSIPPGEFVPIAEQSGLILRLGAWVLDEVCRQLAAWRRSDLPELRRMRVAVNLSAVQIAHDGLVDEVAGALERHGVPPEQLVCEITETSLIADPASASRTLAALRELGIAVALDDFGTGYSSLASLKQYPLSTIKLDRSFICEMAPGNRDEAIVASVLDMARTLSLTTVAEGVETAAQRDTLRALGCDVGQGFLFSRPLPDERLDAWLAARTEAQPTKGGEVRWLRAVP